MVYLSEFTVLIVGKNKDVPQVLIRSMVRTTFMCQNGAGVPLLRGHLFCWTINCMHQL